MEHDFYASANQPDESAGEFPQQTDADYAAPIGKSAIGGGKPAKKPLSKKLKIIYGIAGVVGAAAFLTALQDQHKPAAPAVAGTQPQSAATSAPSDSSTMTAAPAEQNTTIMGASPPDNSAQAQAPAVAPDTSANEPPQTTAATAPASVPEKPAAVASAPAIPTAAAPHPLAQPPVTPSAANATPDPHLILRIQELEDKLAKLEHPKLRPTNDIATSNHAGIRKPALHATKQKMAALAAAKTMPDKPAAPPPSEKAVPPAGNDIVRIIGGTAKPSGAIALIEFAGVKHRAGVGDIVPGLGPIKSISIDGGATSVEINGVVYR